MVGGSIGIGGEKKSVRFLHRMLFPLKIAYCGRVPPMKALNRRASGRRG
ncbi:hypothetical protein B4135_1589 [Caldibacillus debilis]|uniref:Uncharacterized protein n=1 Tax=Caldibacillus debilis TaxID=301148 RepID=A0A150MBP4_9BACI|nr:hypothetical protein B4135_1589 [Caldibacillus debilis]